MDELQGRIPYPVEPLTPPLQCPAHLPISQYAVNIGLALKGTASARSLGESSYSLPDINLLPQIYRPWRPSAKQIYLFLAVVAAMALLFPLYRITTDAMGETAALERVNDAKKSALEMRQAQIRSREPLKRAITQYNNIVAMGGGFTEDLEVINSLAEEVGIEVESISHAGSGIAFGCRADSYLAFRDYVTALEASGRFTTPLIPPEGYPYTKGGTIKLEPKPAE